MGGTQSQPVPVVPRVSISYGQPALTSPGASMLLPVTVANDTSEELPAQRLQLQGDAYWQNTCSVALPPIAPYSECEEVVLQMRCHNNLDPDSLIASLPAYFTLQLDVSKITQRCSLSFWTYTQGLRDYSPATLPGANGADKFVLLAFGLAGSGKSSFYNSVQTLMQKGRSCSPSLHCLWVSEQQEACLLHMGTLANGAHTLFGMSCSARSVYIRSLTFTFHFG